MIVSAQVLEFILVLDKQRWRHSLSPYVKKSAWTADEDRLLIDLHALYPAKWALIARQIAGRTDDACSKRYREALDREDCLSTPKKISADVLASASLKKDEWTTDEDQILINLYTQLGGKWAQVGAEMSRSGLACRNRSVTLQI